MPNKNLNAGITKGNLLERAKIYEEVIINVMD